MLEAGAVAAAVGAAGVHEGDLLAERALAGAARIDVAVAEAIGGDGLVEDGVVIVTNGADGVVVAAAVAGVGDEVGLAEDDGVGVHIKVGELSHAGRVGAAGAAEGP